jgi:glycosyltransferase involved in cell wall biosynthesis
VVQRKLFVISPVKMRNLVLYIPSIETGGVEKNLFYIMDYFHNKFDKIYLVTSSKIKGIKINNKIIQIHPKTNFFLNKSRILKTLTCFFLILKNFKHKNVLILSFQSNFSAIIASRLINSKIIIRLNTSPEKYINNSLQKYFFRFIYALADQIIVNSIGFKKNFKKIFRLDSVYILNPIKKKKLKKKNISFFNNFKGLKILTIGRLTDQKDHITLLKAVLLLKLKYKINFKLYLIGRGHNYNVLKEFIDRNNLEKNVKLAGYKKEAYDYLKSSDLFISTSKYEGLPNTLIESQIANVPIIASNCPSGPSEILLDGKLGDLFKVGNYLDLAKRVNSFYKNKKSLKSKSYLAKKYIYRYDYKYNLDEYIKIIKKYL